MINSIVMQLEYYLRYINYKQLPYYTSNYKSFDFDLFFFLHSNQRLLFADASAATPGGARGRIWAAAEPRRRNNVATTSRRHAESRHADDIATTQSRRTVDIALR